MPLADGFPAARGIKRPCSLAMLDTDSDDACAVGPVARPQPRAEPRLVDAQSSVAEFLSELSSDVGLSVANETYRTLSDAWLALSANSVPDEAYIARSALSHDASAVLLQRFAGFFLDPHLGRLQPRVHLPSLPAAVGATIGDLEFVLSGSCRRRKHSFIVRAVDVDSFGWNAGLNTVPALSSPDGDGVLGDLTFLLNAATTHVGAPTLAKATGRECAVFHRRFGNGTAILAKRSQLPLARPAPCIYTDDTCIIVAIMSDPHGPLVVSAHLADGRVTPPPDVVVAAVESARDFRVTTVVLLSAAGNAAAAVELFDSLGWRRIESAGGATAAWIKEGCGPQGTPFSHTDPPALALHCC